MGLVRRSVAAEGYHGDREARAQGSLTACYRELLEETHVTVRRQQGSLGLWRICYVPNPCSPL